jgi:hypothetical protein
MSTALLKSKHTETDYPCVLTENTTVLRHHIGRDGIRFSEAMLKRIKSILKNTKESSHKKIGKTKFLTTLLLPFLNAGKTVVCFHKDGKVSLATLRLKIYDVCMLTI